MSSVFLILSLGLWASVRRGSSLVSVLEWGTYLGFLRPFFILGAGGGLVHRRLLGGCIRLEDCSRAFVWLGGASASRRRHEQRP